MRVSPRLAAILVVVLYLTGGRGRDAVPGGQAAEFPVAPLVKGEGLKQARLAVQELVRWISAESSRYHWWSDLQTEALQQELSLAGDANPVAVSKIIALYSENTPATDYSPFIEVRRAVRCWLQELPPPPLEQLPDVALAARAAFIPYTPAQVEIARKKLFGALDRLNDRLEQDGANGQRWKEFLQPQALRLLVSQESALEIAELQSYCFKYGRGYTGLNLTWFIDARDSLELFRFVYTNAGHARQREEYHRWLAQLSETLKKYAIHPVPADAEVISGLMQWLDITEQAPWVVGAIRYYYHQPNFILTKRLDQPARKAVAAGPDARTAPPPANPFAALIRDGWPLFRQGLSVSADGDVQTLVGLQTGPNRMGASTPPPEIPFRRCLLQVHESMLNNLAADTVGGMQPTKEELQGILVELAGGQPLPTGEDSYPLRFDFPRQRPITITLDDDRIAITLSSQRLLRDARVYPGLAVTMEYKRVGSRRAIRQGEPFHEKRRLTQIEIVVSVYLKRKLLGEEIDLATMLSSLGELDTWIAKKGWIVLSFK